MVVAEVEYERYALLHTQQTKPAGSFSLCEFHSEFTQFKPPASIQRCKIIYKSVIKQTNVQMRNDLMLDRLVSDSAR